MEGVVFLAIAIWGYFFVKKHNNEKMANQIEASKTGVLVCPKCNSQNIIGVSRGYKVTTGFVGSNKHMNACMVCGHKWEAMDNVYIKKDKE